MKLFKLYTTLKDNYYQSNLILDSAGESLKNITLQNIPITDWETYLQNLHNTCTLVKEDTKWKIDGSGIVEYYLVDDDDEKTKMLEDLILNHISNMRSIIISKNLLDSIEQNLEIQDDNIDVNAFTQYIHDTYKYY